MKWTSEIYCPCSLCKPGDMVLLKEQVYEKYDGLPSAVTRMEVFMWCLSLIRRPNAFFGGR